MAKPRQYLGREWKVFKFLPGTDYSSGSSFSQCANSDACDILSHFRCLHAAAIRSRTDFSSSGIGSCSDIFFEGDDGRYVLCGGSGPALLDHFVEPFLPSFRTGQAPTPSQHQAVARQMHAVVLLYNYFHRKQSREHAFLDFMSFCKLAIVLKPSLMAYMKLMDQVDCSMMDGFESKLSQTEEAIFNACNISLALDASKNVPVTGDWPVSKVAVFLVNSGKEKCMLLDTNGENRQELQKYY
ncbi:unnamed protein product [Cuscuta campestris]|uniref:DUF7913 domain-containing protein n=1 Tax=Cuscuta campestris TaxID=132261 RepID=A0A484MTZ4_9ASTE|nr:unnamed protein product [Cuscuta campestris]